MSWALKSQVSRRAYKKLVEELPLTQIQVPSPFVRKQHVMHDLMSPNLVRLVAADRELVQFRNNLCVIQLFHHATLGIPSIIAQASFFAELAKVFWRLATAPLAFASDTGCQFTGQT